MWVTISPAKNLVGWILKSRLRGEPSGSAEIEHAQDVLPARPYDLRQVRNFVAFWAGRPLRSGAVGQGHGRPDEHGFAEDAVAALTALTNRWPSRPAGRSGSDVGRSSLRSRRAAHYRPCLTTRLVRRSHCDDDFHPLLQIESRNPIHNNDFLGARSRTYRHVSLFIPRRSGAGTCVVRLRSGRRYGYR